MFSKSERDKQEVDGWAGEKPLQATESVTAELQLTVGVVVFSKSERDKQGVDGWAGEKPLQATESVTAEQLAWESCCAKSAKSVKI